MNKELLEKYSENGKHEVKELVIKDKGETFRAVVVLDFNTFRKAQIALVSATMDAKNKGGAMNISTDILGAGDKVLFMGWKEGDDKIRTNMRLRAKACKVLGEWVQDLSDDEEEEEEEEKKS